MTPSFLWTMGGSNRHEVELTAGEGPRPGVSYQVGRNLRGVPNKVGEEEHQP